MELLRDPIRLAFALLGPVILMIAFGFGISFDVKNLNFAAFDQDNTPESRALIDEFASSRYFSERPPIRTTAAMDQRLLSGDVQLVIEIPPGFGRDFHSGSTPEIGAWMDGSMPFRAETIRGYVTGLLTQCGEELALRRGEPASTVTRSRSARGSATTRPIMSAVAVVREGDRVDREFPGDADHQVRVSGRQAAALHRGVDGQLCRFGAACRLSVRRADQGIGRAAGCRNFALRHRDNRVWTARLDLHQQPGAAVFATAILSIVPAVNFSGLLVPVASLSGGARLFGLGFPPAWFQPVSSGAFTNCLGFGTLWLNLVVLALFAVGFLIASQLLLREQER